MNFTVPCDSRTESIDELIKTLAAYPENEITEVYGNIPALRVIGSGRGYFSDKMFDQSFDHLRKYAMYAQERDIPLNYTLNASCTGNIELTEGGQREIIHFVDQLMEIGIKRYTVASLALLVFLRHVYKDAIGLTLSTIASVNSVSRAHEAVAIGASVIVLSEEISRNFALIESIASNTSLPLEIIVNSSCIHNCAYRQSHYNALAHYNHEDDALVQFYTLRCFDRKQSNPVETLKVPWIRPEDLHLYEKTGIQLFKIIGRESVFRMDLPRMLRAYFEREYDGNLLELQCGFADKPPRYLDNRKLDGFIDHFVASPYRCLELCETHRCCYCSSYIHAIEH